jgi:hypothetical protein
MYQLVGKLIDGPQAYRWLNEALPKLTGEASFCSAFLKESILQDFSKKLPEKSNVRILVRWQINDLLSNASDLEAYTFSKKMGWGFYIKLNFHGKVFAVPENGMLVGSANATSAGLGLRVDSNHEIGTIVDPNINNVLLINNLFKSAVKVDDLLFDKIKSALSNSPTETKLSEWPTELLLLLNTENDHDDKFFLSECFISNGSDLLASPYIASQDALKDLSLLGIHDKEFNRNTVIKYFLKSKIFKWTLAQVAQSPEGIRFGTLTNALHSALIEDPSPYRKEVKELVKNLYSWIRLIGPQDSKLEIFQPNFTEILRLV